MLEKNNNSVTFKCVKDNDSSYQDDSLIKYQWKWNGEILNDDEMSDVISVENIDDNDNIIDKEQNFNRLECFASNHAGTSWAFLDWDHILKTWR